MQTVTKFPAGTFSWVDLATTDAVGAKGFYGELFGWTMTDMPVGPESFYTMCHIEGHNVAALSQMQPEQQEQGIPPYWLSYITVDNVDASTDKAEALSGSIIAPPFDVFDAGRMAIVQDPTGAMFAMWQAGTHIGATIVNEPGSLVWNELATPDIETAKKFYTTLFGWETSDADMGGAIYTSIMNKGRSAGGMLAMDEEWGDIPPHWKVYFSVVDIDETIEKAKTLGGNVMMPATDAGGAGRFTIIIDPQGSTFAAIQMNQIEPPPQG